MYSKLKVVALFLLVSACGVESKDSSLDFTVGYVGSECSDASDCHLGIIGHEIITSQAKAIANESARINYFMEEEDPDVAGFKSEDPIVRGNFATDKPTFMSNEFDIYAWQKNEFGIDPGESWHEGGHRQMFHSLRNYKEDLTTINSPRTNQRVIDTNLQTCQTVRDVILRTTRKAASIWKKMEMNVPGNYLIGTTTHTIQDSFSTAHVERDRQTWEFREFCKYGKNKISGICDHSAVEAVTKDYIWTVTSGDDRVRIMKPEARQSARTTAAYLIHVFRITEAGKDFDAEMNDFLSGSKALRSTFTDLPETASFDCSTTRKDLGET